MVVLGIDPGSRRCGYGVVARTGARLSRVTSGVLAPGDLSTPDRLARILEGISAVVSRVRLDAVAVETAYCGRSARSALVLGQARGVALAAAALARLPVFEYAPAEVKLAFTGSGRAEKAQMLRSARALFGLEPRLADEADALAVAVCHLARSGAPLPPRRGGAGARRAVIRPSVRRYGDAP